MKLTDIKIRTQLRVGFAAILLFIIVLGVNSYWQTEKIHQQTETIYNHPLQVRRAIGLFQADILGIQLNMRDVILSVNENNITADLSQIEVLKTSAFEQIAILYSQYLGPRTDVDTLKQTLISWDLERQEIVHLFRDGKTQEAAVQLKTSGTEGEKTKKVLKALEKIDNFARNKASELYKTSLELNNSLERQLLFLVVVIFFISVVVSNYLFRAVSKPIDELTMVTRRFHEGDMNARSTNISKNEFGTLSASFNSMVDNIQVNAEINNKVVVITGMMLREDDAKKFFHSTLQMIMDYTESQMAAAYLLSDDKNYFEHFESIGIDDEAQKSFSAFGFEGEFGPAVSSGEIQHLRNTSEGTRFVFKTVSGKFIPREIITIPILSGGDVIAIISIASINEYSNSSIQLINKIHNTYSARIAGILAYRRILEISRKLEEQNSELEIQQTELSTQSSELTEQNRELEIQKNQLSEASKLKTSFLSNMSHELRTPLNSVIALSGVLNRRLAKKIPEEEHGYLEVIERNGKNLLALINDILDISKIESGREEIAISQFDLYENIDEVVNMILPQAVEKNLQLINAVGDCKNRITTDAVKFRHILQNLISNAVKFTEKGSVTVSVKEFGNNVSIIVTDTGIGISEEHLPYIFDEFRQADSGVSRKFGGTGLGLAIAKKHANLLGGNISVNSILGKGSIFSLTLPLNYTKKYEVTEELFESKKSVISSNIQTMSVSSGANKTVMLVEDSEPALIQMKEFLDESGYNVIIARDGREALELFNKIIPEAIILDLMMPGIDGFQVLKAVRNADVTAHIPVLILTAKHITKEELVFLKRNNIHQLIQKGDIKRDELVKAVGEMVFGKKIETKKRAKKRQTIIGKPRVLVVEDNQDNMTTVKALLSEKFIVIEAVTGKEGVEMAKTHLPDLILMDISLPEMDGIEAFKVIRSDGRLEQIPVIALTATALTEDREVILAHGFDAFLAKPINEQIFFNTIQETLYGE